MTAAIIHLQVVMRPSFHDPAWREQYERACAAQCDQVRTPPPRTRPIVVASRLTPDNFDDVMRDVEAALNAEPRS